MVGAKRIFERLRDADGFDGGDAMAAGPVHRLMEAEDERRLQTLQRRFQALKPLQASAASNWLRKPKPNQEDSKPPAREA